MKILAGSFIIPILLLQPATTKPDRFDLVCKGTTTTETASGAETEAFSRRLRIDLAQGKYCDADCIGLFDLAKVNPATIVISDGLLEAGTYSSIYISYIDRVTGEYHSLENIAQGDINSVMSTIETRGICKPQPFSGFSHLDARF